MRLEKLGKLEKPIFCVVDENETLKAAHLFSRATDLR
jgi:hypothetical protein